MLINFSDLRNLNVLAADGEFGQVHDLLFDDGDYAVRYIVVNTSDWLPGRDVLVPPQEFQEPVWDKSELPVSLTRDQIENSPEISEDEPLSRQKEEELHSYFGWQPYWVDRITGEDYGPPIPAGDEMTGDRQADSVPQDPVPGDPDLLSAESVVGYEIQATDARIGRVDDFLLDDESWEIEYLVIDTGDENENKKTLLASELIERISFDEYAVFVDLDQETIRKSPEYDPSSPINQGYEEALQKHFGY